MSTRPLANQVAVIVGGSRGIGKGIAIKFASLGASIAITYASNSNAADQVRACKTPSNAIFTLLFNAIAIFNNMFALLQGCEGDSSCWCRGKEVPLGPGQH
jgi:NAD(P)-dependent dehydrogenase (short-subunit alcohol dehydrogenase family)